MADDADSGRKDGSHEGPDEADQREVARPEAAAATGGGFLSIYKPGQGYWTRMGTAAAVALLTLLVCTFVYQTLSARTTLDAVRNAAGEVTAAGFPTVKLIVAGLVGLLMLGSAWWYMNKPRTAEFLIATESEMKKVNWTTKRELIGSTKVVIAFMFIIAAILFLIDVVFGYLFYSINVLKSPPF